MVLTSRKLCMHLPSDVCELLPSLCMKRGIRQWWLFPPISLLSNPVPSSVLQSCSSLLMGSNTERQGTFMTLSPRHRADSSALIARLSPHPIFSHFPSLPILSGDCSSSPAPPPRLYPMVTALHQTWPCSCHPLVGACFTSAKTGGDQGRGGIQSSPRVSCRCIHILPLHQGQQI